MLQRYLEHTNPQTPRGLPWGHPVRVYGWFGLQRWCKGCPSGCAALRIVLVTVPRVSRFCEHFPDGFDLHLLQLVQDHAHHPLAESDDERLGLGFRV